jgi:hypothetical protein
MVRAGNKDSQDDSFEAGMNLPLILEGSEIDNCRVSTYETRLQQKCLANLHIDVPVCVFSSPGKEIPKILKSS